MNPQILSLLIFLYELTNPNSFLEYFKDKFENNDVMVIWDLENKPSNLNDIEEFCHQQNWRCTEKWNVRGSEAFVTILYDLESLNYMFYECLTRAKTHLVMVTTTAESPFSTKLQNIEKGIHDDEVCENHCKKYKKDFGQDLPHCEYKGNKSKIQKLIQKVHLDDTDGERVRLNLADNTALTIKNAELLLENAELRKKLDEANDRTENYKQKLKEVGIQFDDKKNEN